MWKSKKNLLDVRSRWQTATSLPSSGRFFLNSFVTKCWVALFVSFLFLRLSITIFWSEENRYFFLWQRSDALAIILLVLGVGALFFLGYEAFSCFGRFGRGFRKFAFIAFGFFYLRISIVETMFSQSGDVPIFLGYLSTLLHIALFAFFAFYPDRAVRLLRNACLLFSPVMVLFFMNIVTARPYEIRVHNPVSIPSSRDPTTSVSKIQIIVFDDMAYRMIFENGVPKEEYKGFSRLADQSLVFHEARSPAAFTLQSLPSLFLGVTGSVVFENRELLMNVDDKQVRINGLKNIFADMRERGYRTHWYGTYIPPRSVIADGLDLAVIKSYDLKPMGTSVSEVAASLFVLHCHKRLSRVFPFFSRFMHQVYTPGIAAYDAWIHHMALQQFQDSEKTFSFLHFRTPHYPMIHDDYGIVSSITRIRPIACVNAYRGAVRSADRVLQDILDMLESQPWRDETILVITADHAFRFEPGSDYADALKVPLFIRLPSGGPRKDIHETVQIHHLRHALTQYLDSDLSMDVLVDVLTRRKESL